MKKRIAKAVAALTAVSMLAGCGAGSSASKETIKESTSAETTQAETSASKGNPQGQTITFWHSMGGVNGEAMA